MNTITPSTDVPLPSGADPEVDNWEACEDGFVYRLVWSTPVPLPETLAVAHNDIRVVCTQLPDGLIVTDDPTREGPFVYFGNQDYRAEDIRVLAQALLTAADLADQWAGVK